jgi:hypothetical protein
MMTKWLAILSFVLAILVRLTWHSSSAIAVRLDETTHRGYSVSTIIFWTLLVVGIALSLVAIAKRTGQA